MGLFQRNRGREREREIEKWLKEEKETVVWKGLQISFRCDTRRIYDWNETTPKRGLIREKNKMRRNSGDQIFIKIVGFSSFYDRFIIDIASFELRGGKNSIDPDVIHVVPRFRHGDEI